MTKIIEWLRFIVCFHRFNDMEKGFIYLEGTNKIVGSLDEDTCIKCGARRRTLVILDPPKVIVLTERKVDEPKRT